jgi:flagellin-like protein
MMLKSKKGVSPVIATVLLISMVVVIAVIVFIWFRSMTKEAITKFGDTNIELVCNDVMFDASYDHSGLLSIVNTGNVPIFGMKIKAVTSGKKEQFDLKEISNWPAFGLNSGSTFSSDVGADVGDPDQIILTPVLLGTSDSGDKSFVCDEKQYGVEITV